MKGRLTYAIGGVLLLTIFVALISFLRLEIPTVTASLQELQEEGIMYLEEDEIYLVNNEGDPLALSSDAQHIGDRVTYCPSSNLFEAAHGEKFNILGYYYAGPARRGLDRYPLEVEGDVLTVDLERPIEGAPRGEGPRRSSRQGNSAPNGI